MNSKEKLFEKERIFLAILIIGLALRLWKLDLPLLEFYPTRQVQTAEITQNLIRDNFNFLYPRVDYYGPDKKYYLIEFPGYNLVVASIHKLLGNVSDFNGRIVSIFSYVIATIFLYKITLGLFSRQVGLIAIFFFSLSPLNILTSRSFQPEEMMLASSLGTLYFLIKWRERKSWKFILFSYFFFAWALLIKVVAFVFLFLPVIYLLRRFKNNYKRGTPIMRFGHILYLPIGLLPSIIWYLHSYEASTRLSTFSSNAFNLFIWFDPKNIINWKFYSTIFSHEYSIVLLPLGMMLFLIGLASKLIKDQLFVYWWLAGIILYFLFFNKHTWTHEYYHLPILPIASIFIGIGADRVLNTFKNLRISKGLLVCLLAALTLVLMLPPTLSRAYKPIDRFSNVVEAAKALKQISNPDDLVIGIMDRGPTLIYYADRVGWQFGLDREARIAEEEFYTGNTPQLTSPIYDLEKYRGQGAKYLAIANIDQFNSNSDFKKYVIDNFRSISGADRYLIFDLRN